MRLAPVVAALCWAASHADAAELDCAQVKLIVPYPAGGATDVAARVVAERLEAALKKSVVIETRPGATGNIGTMAVVNAKPDGCTLLVNAAVIATFPYSFNRLNYDPINDRSEEHTSELQSQFHLVCRLLLEKKKKKNKKKKKKKK